MRFTILKYTESGKNSINQSVFKHVEKGHFDGWLDMLSGDDKNQSKSIPAESSHVILTKDKSIKLTNADRIKTAKGIYEVTYVDDPVNLGHHLEIYLKVVS
ncbi:phage head-tail adapter protein [Streptococcus dysgalactiae]|uniref:phage head-tail adapter protein n=1 Tax=Streptococcus dysgalactiae TaxID=1334 RepID=UPI003F6A3DF7